LSEADIFFNNLVQFNLDLTDNTKHNLWGDP